MSSFHATRRALQDHPPAGPVATAYRIRAAEALEDLVNLAMEEVPRDFRAVISTLYRYHRHVSRANDSLDAAITLVPVLISGGQIQIEVRVHGALSTVSGTEPAVRHPVEHKETLVLSSGEPHAVDLEVPSSDAAEGWSGVRYRFDVVPSF